MYPDHPTAVTAASCQEEDKGASKEVKGGQCTMVTHSSSGGLASTERSSHSTSSKARKEEKAECNDTEVRSNSCGLLAAASARAAKAVKAAKAREAYSSIGELLTPVAPLQFITPRVVNS